MVGRVFTSGHLIYVKYDIGSLFTEPWPPRSVEIRLSRWNMAPRNVNQQLLKPDRYISHSPAEKARILIPTTKVHMTNNRIEDKSKHEVLWGEKT